VIRVVVAASTLAVRAGLRSLLNAASISAASALEVIDEAATLADLEPTLPETDVLLLASEVATQGELKQILLPLSGQLALLLLTDDPQAARGFKDLPLRAWGVVTYDASAEELAAAVLALHEGLLVGTPALLEPLLPRFLSNQTEQVDSLTEPLTERESEVLQYLARGLANKQIAATLGISEHTVKFHVSSIYAKLGATNRTEAVRTGVKQGLVLL
jgi:DNA-binding NarL/FixJ family response regulator